jgi:hypothetical protein
MRRSHCDSNGEIIAANTIVDAVTKQECSQVHVCSGCSIGVRSLVAKGLYDVCLFPVGHSFLSLNVFCG